MQVVYGGTGYEQQRKAIEEQGVDILIGTPGRLIDYFKQHVFDLRAIQVLVMDEADRCDELLFMRSGVVIARGTSDALRESAGTTDLEQAFLHFAGDVEVTR